MTPPRLFAGEQDFSFLLADVGVREARRWLGVEQDQLERWEAGREDPPVMACTALYLLSSWCDREVQARAVNTVAVANQQVMALRTELSAAQRVLEQVSRSIDYGAANEPSHRTFNRYAVPPPPSSLEDRGSGSFGAS